MPGIVSRSIAMHGGAGRALEVKRLQQHRRAQGSAPTQPGRLAAAPSAPEWP